MLRYSEYIREQNEVKNDRNYNDILKKMGVMDNNGNVNLENMIQKVNKFLQSDDNKSNFLKDLEDKEEIGGDVVKVKIKKLKPGQKTIFLDQVFSRMLSDKRFTKKTLKGKVKDTDILISGDNHIIDGHHRWCSAFLLNPKCKLKCTQINLPFEQALPILNAILGATGSENHQGQSGNDKYNVYDLIELNKDDLAENLAEIIDRVASVGLWGTGEKKENMISEFFDKISKKIDDDIHPINHFVKNIHNLPHPENIVSRKDMPQLSKDEIKDIIKNY